MIVGVDFDNTIVCYDAAFHQAAGERGLIPVDLPATKEAVRDYLRQVDREDDWTELQGYVYGARMATVSTFPGVTACLRGLVARGVTVLIISHKTLHPYRGPAYNLHTAARSWLESSGFLAEAGLAMENVYFELSKEEKLARIGTTGCSHFIDDLPELLAETAFPAGVVRMLFSPEPRPEQAGILAFPSWLAIAAYFRGANGC